jgi:thiamine biosynthesis lipoprotein
MGAADAVRVRHPERVMGTVVSFNVTAPFAGEPLAAAVRWLHWVDETFSTYRADSFVSRLGRGEIGLADCPPEVAEVLAACEALNAATSGYFSAWYAGTLDPSGYVKGWAIERAAALLTAAGSASHCVNGGGDVRCVGARRGDAEPWRVAIADPRPPLLQGALCRDALCAVVAGRDIAVATSGIAERGAHIIDPVRGEPATGLLSVTVVGPDLAAADAYATACVAMGYPGAFEWLTGLDGYQGFGIRADGSSWETAGFGEYRSELD